MNYRQWKKKYKKEHGYNPPLTDDKRKQYKAVRKCIKGIKKINMQKLITEEAKNINKAFADAFEIISKGFANIAEQLRG